MKSVYSGLLAALLLSACASGPALFSSTDPTANFGTYKTYGFISPLGTDGPAYSSVLSQLLKAATIRELEARGYRPADNPDLLVNFHVESKEKIRSTTSPAYGGYYGYRAGYYGTWGGYGGTEITQYTEGTLTVDLVDSARRQLVWEGTAVGRVRDQDRENVQAAVDAIMPLLFAKFPYRAAP